MFVSTPGPKSTQPVVQTQNNELVHRLEDYPPFSQTPFAACRHLLAMFVAVIVSALLVRQALGLPAQDTQHTISMSLSASSVALIIQTKVRGPVGSRLLSIQGTSFNSVAPLTMGGATLKTGSADVPIMMAALFSTLMLASCTKMVISRALHLARCIITSLVSDVVVMTIGLSLIQVGLTSIGGGYAAMGGNAFGVSKNLLLTDVVLVLIILLNRQCNPYLRMVSLVIVMAAEYVLVWFMGMLPESNEPMIQGLIMVSTPLYYGLGIGWGLLLSLMLTSMIIPLGTIGDITATSDIPEQLVSGPLYMKRLRGGVPANGLNSFVSTVSNTFPNPCFGQNNGVIQLTGVASRYVGLVVALVLIVLGLFLVASGFVQHTPESVLGGTMLIMFGTIAVPGVCVASREPLNRRAILIIVPSLAVGLGVSQQLLVLQSAPEWLKNLLSSGIVVGGTTATVLNLIFPPEKQ